jgi:dTDP-glucose 4,6-dehydratase
LEAAKRFNIKLFCHISTDEVYGSIDKGAFKEDDPLRPNSPYSASKAAGDLIARSYFITYKLPVIITRSSNNFGPYQYPEKVIPLFITNALEEKKLPLYADGMNMRDWLYVEDNCEAIDVVMRKGAPGQIYNIGAGNEITNIELTHTILSILGKDKALIEFVTDRPGHDKRYALDISQIRSLGWKPKHDFRLALKATIDWYKANRAWWKRLIECRQEIKY